MARKKKSTRPLRPVLPYIIGAGITEKYYFGHLKRECNYQVEVRPKFFGSDNAYDMQKWVENALSIGGTVICVFDMDTTRWDEAEKIRKERFLSIYGSNPDVFLCGSMPSIEYWFLLHFERTNCYYETSEKVIQKLRNHIPFEKTEKFLSKPGWVETLLAEGRMLQAMRHAEELGTNGESYTHIPEAIRFLEKHKKK